MAARLKLRAAERLAEVRYYTAMANTIARDHNTTNDETVRFDLNRQYWNVRGWIDLLKRERNAVPEPQQSEESKE